MKITHLAIPDGYLGLKSTDLRDLGDIVIFAGANGSGKSRMLQAVADFAEKAMTEEQERAAAAQADSYRLTNEQYERARSDLSKLTPGSEGERYQNEMQLGQLSRTMEPSSQAMRQREQELSDALRITLAPRNMRPVIVHYSVKNESLRSWRQMTDVDSEQQLASVKREFNIALMPIGGIAAVHHLIKQFVALSHGNTRKDGQTVSLNDLKEKIEELRVLLRDFLDAELEWDDKLDPMIFGRSMSDPGLSRGQQILLQIALSLFFQNGKRDELILLLDEPENHLHPAALVKALDKIREACSNAQIWIATHSVPLLAKYDSDAVFFVKDGSLQQGKTHIRQIIESLMGGPNGVDLLADLIDFPERQAIVQFATACMRPAQVVETGAGDPQTTQIKKILSDAASQGRKARILDFGAGRGRLLTELASTYVQNGGEIQTEFDYLAFDIKNDQVNKECLAKLRRYYTDAESRLLIGMNGLRSIDKGSVDVAILCNTLHELPIDEWLKYFGHGGVLTDLLHPDGYLLIVEDQILPVGELAHRFGFLVFDRTELTELFGLSRESFDLITVNHFEERYAGRLKAHLIKSFAVKNVSRASILSALTSLHTSAQNAAEQLRTSSRSDSRTARKFAFWTQQYFNSGSAIRALG